MSKVEKLKEALKLELKKEQEQVLKISKNFVKGINTEKLKNFFNTEEGKEYIKKVNNNLKEKLK